MKKVTLIVFAMLSSSVLAVGPGLIGIGFNGGLGLTGGQRINTGFGFNRFGLGVIGNGYLGYNNGHGYNSYNGISGLNGFGLHGNGYGHRGFGNSLLGVGFGRFGGVYH